ncbi:MAG: LarC family nickel insertion protein [Pseudomonadota bacterium]
MHLHFDPLGGAAGDMVVAALASARPDIWPRAAATLNAVLPPSLTPTLTEGRSHGFAGTRFSLIGSAPPAPSRHADLAAHLAAHCPDAAVTTRAQGTLRRLAEAEATVHGVPVETVHFHEIGDWDTLADAVAAAALMEAMGATTLSVAPFPLGGGRVRSAHGPLPVPAPATAHLLRGFDITDDGIPGERVTPTGAAILAEATPGEASGRLVAVGAGLGTRDLSGVANLLRVLAFAPTTQGAAVDVIECAVDDMTGEEIGHASAHLRGLSGVLDLALTPRQGKKGRPETLFTLLVAPHAREEAITALFEETATLGVRIRREARRTLPRHADQAAGIAIKRAERPGGATSKAEADDLAPLKTLAARRRAARTAEDD